MSNRQIPQPPKRPLAPFFLFKQDIYDSISQQYPNLKLTEKTLIIVQKWKEIGYETKQKYEVQFNQDKERYEKLKLEYTEKYGQPIKKKKSKKQVAQKPQQKQTSIKISQPPPPKRPLAAFFLFKMDIYEQVKKENPGLFITELAKIVCDKWKNLDEEQKQKYHQKHLEQKQQYEKNYQKYIQLYGSPIKKSKRKRTNIITKQPYIQQQQLDNKQVQKQQKKKQQFQLEPQATQKNFLQRPLIPYMQYKQDMYEQMKNTFPLWNTLQINEKIEAQWKQNQFDIQGEYKKNYQEQKKLYDQNKKK